MTVHAAGWLEGGLTLGYEKFILDIESLQTIAELARPAPADEAALGFDAIAEVQPGGHFFSVAHTMERYQTAFYRPLVADLSNHGAWTEAGALTADQRATAIWKQRLADFTPPEACDNVADRLDGFVQSRSETGGAAARRLRVHRASQLDFVYRSEYVVINVHKIQIPQR